MTTAPNLSYSNFCTITYTAIESFTVFIQDLRYSTPLAYDAKITGPRDEKRNFHCRVATGRFFQARSASTEAFTARPDNLAPSRLCIPLLEGQRYSKFC